MIEVWNQSCFVSSSRPSSLPRPVSANVTSVIASAVCSWGSP